MFRIIQYEHNNAHFTERFVLYRMNIMNAFHFTEQNEHNNAHFSIIQYEHNNAHFIECFVLYRMNIIMHILQNVPYDR